MRTKVLEVTHATAPGALAGSAIDKPTAGDERGDWALDVRGWAVGEDGPVTSVEGAHEGTVLWRVPPVLDRPQVSARFPQAGGDPVGFYALPSVLALPPRHEIELTAMIRGRAAPIGSIVAERAPLTTTFEPRRQPILITTFGRTGSMLLMRLLSSHPDVLSYRPHRFEQRIAGYWIEALLALSDPASYLRGVTPQTVARQGVEDRTWWLGIDAPTAQAHRRSLRRCVLAERRERPWDEARLARRHERPARVRAERRAASVAGNRAETCAAEIAVLARHVDQLRHAPSPHPCECRCSSAGS